MITWSYLDTGKAIRSPWIGVRCVGPSVEVEVELCAPWVVRENITTAL